MSTELSKILYNILVNYTYKEYNEAYNIAKTQLLNISNSYNTIQPVTTIIESPTIESVTVESPAVVSTVVETPTVVSTAVETSDDTVKNVNVVDKTVSVKQPVILKRVLTKKEQRDKERETKEKNRENKISEKSLLTKDNLKKWVCDEGYSAAYIAREFIGCRQEKVGDKLKEFGIVKSPK